MIELLDTLIIRIIVVGAFLAFLFLFKYAHLLLYPSARYFILKNFSPDKAPCESFYFFSRLVGLAIIFSSFSLNLQIGPVQALILFFVKGLLFFLLYFLGIWAMETVTMPDFDYKIDIQKNKSWGITLTGAGIGIGVSFILSNIALLAENSALKAFVMWSYALIIIGLCLKISTYLALFPIQLLIRRNFLGAVWSLLGPFAGFCLLTMRSFPEKFTTLSSFFIHSFSSLALSGLILPLFIKGMTFLYKLRFKQANSSEDLSIEFIPLTTGLAEGAIFYTSAHLTGIIVSHIQLGQYYPL